MSYTRETLSKVEKILNDRKNQAETQQAERTALAQEKIPALLPLQKKLADTITGVIRSISAGTDPEKLIREISKQNLSIQEEIGDLLVSNGFERDFLDVKYTCPKCGDTGYAGSECCECRQALLKEVALASLRSASPAGRCTFENFRLDYYPDKVEEETGISPRGRMEQIYSFCKDYADDFSLDSESLYLWGSTGLGKTHLASAIAGVVAQNGYQVIFDSSSNLLRKLEKEHFSSSRDTTYDGAQDELINCELLIIDDFGTEFCTQFTVSAIYNVINSRINKNLPVIISSNLDIEGIEKVYSERIASRIIGSYRSIRFFGNDIRQIKKNL